MSAPVPSFSRTLALNADKPDYDRLAKVRSAVPRRTRATILATRAPSYCSFSNRCCYGVRRNRS